MSAPRIAVPAGHRLVEGAGPVAAASAGRRGLDVAKPSATATSLAMHHPAHAVTHRAEVRMSAAMKSFGLKSRRAAAVTRGDDELRMGLGDVIGLDERLDRELPVHGEWHAYHHSVRTTPSSTRRGPCRGLEESRNGGAVRVQVDPRAPAHVSHRTGTRSMSPASRLCSENSAVGAPTCWRRRGVAPAMERAREPFSHVPAAAATRHTAVSTQVLERVHADVGVAHHDHRLVEDLVGHEVVRGGILPRDGTPSATTELATAARLRRSKNSRSK